MERRITNTKEYDEVMAQIHTIMKKGEVNTTTKENEELRILALLAQEYESRIFAITSL